MSYPGNNKTYYTLSNGVIIRENHWYDPESKASGTTYKLIAAITNRSNEDLSEDERADADTRLLPF